LAIFIRTNNHNNQNCTMTTKAPSPVQPAPATALEKAAYAAVASIPTLEPHDRDRLGYCVWRWLKEKRDSLEQSVHNAGARLLISEEEALEKIRANLKQQGIPV
jgi:hypothetical protein